MANWRALAAQAAAVTHVPAPLLDAQIMQESHGNPKARSSAGAEGIAQFMPATARSMGVNPWDPGSAIAGMARMDAANFAKYHNWKDVLSIYNSGRGWATGRQIGQTRNYVDSILSAAGFPNLGGAHNERSQGGGAMSGIPGLDAAMGQSSSFKQIAGAMLMQAAANGGQFDPGSLLGLVAARNQMQVSTPVGGSNAGGGQSGSPGPLLAGSSQGGGFLPKGATYKGNRADQGRDFQTNSGGAIIAPGDGQVLAVKSDPHGFGPAYPIVQFTTGPYKGRTMYIGHTISKLPAGTRFRAGTVLSHTGTRGIGNATLPGWAEIGYAPHGNPGPFGQPTPF